MHQNDGASSGWLHGAATVFIGGDASASLKTGNPSEKVANLVSIHR
jgi:hypothetical protein